ncbi:hypothetical protein CWR48_13300 [Oceanobacillus arenosus]|uniref:Uncharacterized protein n=1 Tax=Oceanobacillus arenosus TaxID=1229153 RepID=A0A3D8PN10_9BACI|nr:hypothetical protein [Oceanobacillus arenosus]RDW17496.1 hypothetical protein CWR48_13300 [Oceanobacillus arenosus]
MHFKDENQMTELLHISFVDDEREAVPDIDKAEMDEINGATTGTKGLSELHLLRRDIWTNFVQ